MFSMRIVFFRRWIETNYIVNSQQLHSGFGGEFEAFDLAERRLDNATSEIVGHAALTQIQSVMPQILPLFHLFVIVIWIVLFVLQILIMI